MRIIRFGYPWMIVWAIGVHIMWGLGLLLRPTTESLLILVGLNRLIDQGIPPHMLGYGLVLASMLAGLGLACERRIRMRYALAMLLPQYGLMITAFLSDLEVFFNATNPVTQAHIDRVLIMIVLGPMMLAAALHTLSIIERFVLEPRREPDPD